MTRMADGSEGPNGIVKLVDPQVTAKAKRRRFTAEFKRRILREADALAETGGIGEMLRREGCTPRT
jgi:transposase